MDQKIWNLTDTGVVFHVFKADGTAQCRKTTKVAPHRQLATESHVDRVVAQPLGYRKCASCAKKEAAFRDRAEASMQPSNGEGDCLPPAKAAEACICPVRTDYHSLDCMTFRAAHSAPNTDTEENDDVTIKEGPLTERQVRIIEGLLVGKRHEEISRNLSTPDETVTVSVVKQECQNITAKFKAKTITQAVFVYSEAQAYRKAAAEILRGLIPVPIDETEVHTNHVLEDLAKLYQGRHDAWMPA